MFALIAAVVLFLDLVHLKLGGLDLVVLALFCLAIHLFLVGSGYGPGWVRGQRAP